MAVNYYKGNIVPEDGTIFVFGSNPEGRHGRGSAKCALNQFGAIYGQGEGLQGNSYALPTKDLRIKEKKSLRSISQDDIIENIRKMYACAREHPDKTFKVAYRNGLDEESLCGYNGKELITMFKEAGEIPSNVWFSEEWINTHAFDDKLFGVWQPPFRNHIGLYIVDFFGNRMFQFGQVNPETKLKLIDILNSDESDKYLPEDARIEDKIWIKTDKYKIMLMRGWGYLTGSGGLNLSDNEVIEIQDKTIQWAFDKLTNKSQG